MCASLPIKPAALALAAGLVCMPLGIHAKADVQRYAIVMEALGRPKDDALAQKLDSLEVFLAKNGTPQPEARQVITTHLRASFLNPSLIPELVALVRDISAVTGTDIVLENGKFLYAFGHGVEALIDYCSALNALSVNDIVGMRRLPINAYNLALDRLEQRFSGAYERLRNTNPR